MQKTKKKTKKTTEKQQQKKKSNAIAIPFSRVFVYSAHLFFRFLVQFRTAN